MLCWNSFLCSNVFCYYIRSTKFTYPIILITIKVAKIHICNLGVFHIVIKGVDHVRYDAVSLEESLHSTCSSNGTAHSSLLTHLHAYIYT